MADITEEAVVTGPSMMDKALVGVVWALALVYSLLTQQILSKEVDIPCSVRLAQSLVKTDHPSPLLQ